MSPLSDKTFQKAKKYLSKEQDILIDDAQYILKILPPNHIHDYAFIVSSVSKAYEGYLKDFFFKIGIISREEHDSDRFRVGKTLNPSLRYKRFSVFQKLSDLDSSGEELAEILWDAWKFGRNEIFHFFPGKIKYLNRKEAENRILLLLEAIIKSGKFLEANKHYTDLIQ